MVADGDDGGDVEAAELHQGLVDLRRAHPSAVEQVADDQQSVDAALDGGVDDGAEPEEAPGGVDVVADVHIGRMKEPEVGAVNAHGLSRCLSSRCCTLPLPDPPIVAMPRFHCQRGVVVSV